MPSATPAGQHGFEPRLRQLVGYGVYRNLIGHVDKQSPETLLGRDAPLETIWDRASKSPSS